MLSSARYTTLLVLVALGAALLLAGCPSSKPVDTSPGPSLPPKSGQQAADATDTGETYQVVISTKPGQWNLDERVRGYEETFAKEFPNVEIAQIIDDETKYSVGQQKASAALNANPGIDAFAGVNAASGPGVAAAVKDAGRDGEIIIVAMDGDSPVLDLIGDGVVTASVAQRQYFMTYIGVKYLYGLKHGYCRAPGDTEADQSLIEIPAEIDTGTVEINSGNVELFRTLSQGAKEELAEKHPEWLELLSDRKPGEAGADEEYVAIGISTGVEYWNATKAGLADVGEELGVKCNFDGPQEHKPDEQANVLDLAIARKPAGILIAPGNPETLKPYIDRAMDEGIPVICFDTDSPDSKRIAYFGTSNYEAGVMGARILGNALTGGGAE